MTLLVIGQAPSRQMSPGDTPLWGTKALTLMAKHAGVSPRERLYDLAYFVNMIEDYPGADISNPKYDAYPYVRAVEGLRRIESLLTQFPEFSQILVLGSANRDTLYKQRYYMKRPEWFRPYQVEQFPGRTWYNSPHPGGTSMWWNDQSHVAKAQAFYRRLFAAQSSENRTIDRLSAGSNRRIHMESL